MLDLNYLRTNLKTAVEKSKNKGVIIDEKQFLEIDEKRRKRITEIDGYKSDKNRLAKEIGIKRAKGEESSSLENESKELNEKISLIESDLSGIEAEFNDLILNIPNMYDDSVPVGRDESDNVVIREWGKKPEFDFEPKPHWEIGEINKFLDLPRASKIAGARFALYFGSLAKLERVLINFMLEVHTEENGYLETLPPFLANKESLTGTGNLPKFKKDLFKIEDYELYLIPTAEVPLTNIHRSELLSEEELTKKYVAYTPCFRSEAGSHGRDVRGITRQHQFNKVELLKFTRPEDSYDELEKLTSDAENILKKLGLHYRVVMLSTGDLSFSSAKTYDLEVWMPGRNKFVEISSCSNFEDFQARRSKIKYKDSSGKK
ncbi:MAG: serine--tRNA ligase, partial [Candidatus Aminicenantes bacterium]|nr:serine--tRNA ligase [Candidatus Aminicenantes bacterium]